MVSKSMLNKNHERGATMVELAIITPLLVILIAVLIDLSLAYIGDQRIRFIITKTARQAALNSTLDTSQAGALRDSAQSQIRSILGANQLSVSVSTPYDDTQDTIPDKVIHVSASGAFKHLFLGLVGFATHQVQIDVYMRYEAQNLYVAPPPT